MFSWRVLFLIKNINEKLLIKKKKIIKTIKKYFCNKFNPLAAIATKLLR